MVIGNGGGSDEPAPGTSTGSGYDYTQGSVEQWAAAWGLHAAMLPFEGRKTPTVELFRGVRTAVESAHETQRTITRDHVPLELVGPEIDLLRVAFRVHGSWRLMNATGTRVAFANPGYVHRGTYPSLTDRDERIDYLHENASYGVLRLADAAPRLGITLEALRSFKTHHGLPWDQWRRAGRHIMARTWATIAAWGYEKKDLADAFGVTPNVVYKWTARYAETFDPPRDPTRPRSAPPRGG